jgi:nicotinamide-nucleotide amidase
MKAEIIAVGSELLLGDVINSNAAWLSKELAELGIDVYHHVTVGDNPARIQAVIQQALDRPDDSRADVLVFTGGLGPTEDDLTIATIADFFKTELVVDPESEATIRNYFIARDMPMSNTNLKQAKKPVGAETVKNPVGTAPGIAWDLTEKTGKRTYILTFPGVPKELYAMWKQGRSFLQQRQQETGEQPLRLIARTMHFFGIGESKLGEMLRDLMENGNPTVAPYVGRAEVKIRIAAKAKNEEEAEKLIEPVRKEILKRAANWCYGENDCTLESAVAELLKSKGLSVAVAESCTGGMISNRLTDVPGSNAYTFINMTTYGNLENTKFVNVNPATLMEKGAVSLEVAGQMARGIKETSSCDIGLSSTGIAGPDGGSEEKPVGLVYLGFHGLEGDKTIVKKMMVNKNYERADIKYWFSQYALHFLRLYIMGQLESDFDLAETSAEAETAPGSPA